MKAVIKSVCLQKEDELQSKEKASQQTKQV